MFILPRCQAGTLPQLLLPSLCTSDTAGLKATFNFRVPVSLGDLPNCLLMSPFQRPKSTPSVKSYLKAAACLRQVHKAAERAKASYDGDDAKHNRAVEVLREKVAHLADVWPESLETEELKNLARHASFAEEKDFKDIASRDVTNLQKALDEALIESFPGEVGFEQLIHPSVAEHSLEHYHNGHYREAVGNGMLALSRAIRQRTGVDLDGADLASAAFTPLDSPKLLFGTLDSKSGKSEQDGFHQIMRGAYIGIRNPKAHQLDHDLDSVKAAQYLVFISLLVRRVDEAKINRKRKPVAQGRSSDA